VRLAGGGGGAAAGVLVCVPQYERGTLMSHSCRGLAAVLLAGGACVFAAHAEAKIDIPARTCNVVQYGAKATKLWFDTEAFQKAIDDCAAKGGGTVEVPRGLYLVGPLFLKSNIELHIAKYAEVLASTDPAAYGATKVPTSAEGQSAKYAFINIAGANNVAITGEGLIDGQGYVWWEWMRDYWRNNRNSASNGAAHQAQRVTRPRLVIAKDSTNLKFEGVTFANSPSFNLVLQNDDHVVIRGVSILAPAHSPNTDGIDPTDSRDVLIENSLISCGDDVVAIKSNGPDAKHPDAVTADIVIRGNTIRQGRGISIGSGTSGGVKNVLIENNDFTGSMYGFRIKTRRDHGGEVSNIVFRNSKMADVQTVLVISGYYESRPLDPDEAARQVKNGGFIVGDQLYPPDSDPKRPFVQDKTPNIHDVTVENVTATNADRVGFVTGLPEKDIAGVHFRNLHIEANSGLLVRNADVAAENVVLAVKTGKPLTLQKHGSFKTKK
jgi:polygalacturonase